MMVFAQPNASSIVTGLEAAIERLETKPMDPFEMHNQV
jgi:hypothetical protein